MIDIPQFDCREVVTKEIGEPAKRSGNYCMWRCPFCGKNSQTSFTAWGDCWKCWKGCGGGDAIKFIELWRGLSFKEALAYLGGDTQTPKPLPAKYEQKQAPSEPEPDENWHDNALAIVNRAIHILWSPEGKVALDYLRERGIEDWLIRDSALGYIPHVPPKTKWRGISLSSGLTFPAESERGQLRSVRVRAIEPNAKIRYISLSGGKMFGSLFGGHRHKDFLPVIITEGDINALSVMQCVGMSAIVFSTASATNKLSPNWLRRLLSAPYVWFWGDDDAAGRAWVDHHCQLSPNFKGLVTSEDPNDLLRLHGKKWLREFIRNQINPIEESLYGDSEGQLDALLNRFVWSGLAEVSQ